MGNWTVSHGEAILAEVITGNLTQNQTVSHSEAILAEVITGNLTQNQTAALEQW